MNGHSSIIYYKQLGEVKWMKWKSLSCVQLCDPMDYTVHGILQARILEWVAVPFSKDLPNPGIKPRSPTLQADSLPAEPQEKPRKQLGEAPQMFINRQLNQQSLAPPDHGILLDNKKEWTFEAPKNVDKPQNNSAEQKKARPKK